MTTFTLHMDLLLSTTVHMLNLAYLHLYELFHATLCKTAQWHQGHSQEFHFFVGGGKNFN